jgi:hypothetical protein
MGGATVGFFFRDRVIASYAPTDVAGVPTQNDLEGALATARKDKKFLQGERSASIDLDGHGRAVYSLVAGSASENEVGYAVARPYSLLTSPFAAIKSTTSDDVTALPKIPIAGGVLLCVLIGMGLVYAERDKPLREFRRGLVSIAAGEATELDIAGQRGAYRRLAEAANDAIEKSIELQGGKVRAAKADLGKILGPAEAAESSAFSFGSSEGIKAGESVQPMAMPSPGAMPPPVVMPAPGAAPPPSPSPPAAPPPSPGPPRSESVHLDAPGADPGPPEDDSDEDEDATVIAEVPEELRQAAAAEDSHFRQVFDKYVSMKRQCGEPTMGLTYDKFVGTLRKNRSAILSKHDAKDVRFTVYEKAGKAALKATPVRA